jgi:hypothetical protein
MVKPVLGQETTDRFLVMTKRARKLAVAYYLAVGILPSQVPGQ